MKFRKPSHSKRALPKHKNNRTKRRAFRTGLEALERRLVLDSTVVFNEIMYNPTDDPADELEWIELHNQLAVDMDVSAWHLEGGVDFEFPDGTIVPGRGYLVVASNPAALEAASGISNVIGPFTGRLANAGEELRLFNNDGRRMNVLDYGDNGDWPVEPDGGGASLAKADITTNSEDAENWTYSAQIGGTPGVANVVSSENIQLNEIAGADDGDFFIEIANDGSSSVNVGGYVLSATGLAGDDYVLPSQTIPAGGLMVVEGSELGFSPADGERLFLYSPGKDRLIDGRVTTNSLRGRSDEHDGQWLWPDVATPGSANSFAFHDEIVINEIMYHAPPQLRTDTEPYLESEEEWIELYNRSGETVDLSGWRLRDAVEFEFEVGTTLGPGEYLVVAKDAEAVKTKYVISNVVGNFDRKLSNQDDRILLVDANKNPADEVHYFERGKWAEAADGGGSSLELRDADADNSRGAAWAASDETERSVWTEYTYRGTANEPLNCCGGLNEFVFGMLDGSEILLDDVSLVKNPAPSSGELVESGTFDTEADFLNDWASTGDVQWSGSGAVRLDNLSDPPQAAVLSQFVPAARNVRYQIQFDTTSLAGIDDLRFLVKSQSGQTLLNEKKVPTGHHSFSVTARDGALELRFYIKGSGVGRSIELDNVSMQVPPVLELIQNGTFEGDPIGASPAKWRFNGNHSGTVIVDPDDPTNQVVRVVADGPQQWVQDNVETTFTIGQTITSNATYEVSFRAKWLSGSRQLNNRLYFTRMSNTAILDAPEKHGTPGQENSTAESNVGPTYTDFGALPVLPASNQPVTVSARPSDPDGVTSMKLWWSNNGGTWRSVTMTDNGSGLYTGTIPGHGDRTRIQFYVEGRDSLGAVSTFPAEGRDSRAMYQVDSDGQETPRPVDWLRLVMRSSDASELTGFGNRYLQMSSKYLGTTLIVNGETAFYDVDVRLVGSGFIRPNSGYKVRLDPEQRFYGVHDTIRFDTILPDEIIFKQMVSRAGGSSVSMYDDVSWLVRPSGGTTIILLQLTRYEDIYLDEQFENGGDGTKFELDDITYPVNPNPSPEGTKTNRSMTAQDMRDRGDNPEAYRGQLLIKNNRAKDNLASMAALSQALNKNGSFVGSELDLATQEVMDVDLWMRHYATQAYLGSWDTYGFGRPKNLRVYVRPEDGKIIPLYWDVDRYRLSDPLIYNGGSSRLDEVRNIPTNTRLFWGHMWDLTERAFNREYTTYWVSHFNSLGVFGMPSAATFGNRANQARNQAKSTIPEIDFRITTNGGNSISTDQNTVQINGDGWIDVRQIRFAGSETPLDVTWTDNNSWTITLPVAFGPNTLAFEAYDFQGRLTGSDTILVTSSSQDVRVADVLRLSEVMYNPADPSSNSIYDNDDFEFIELVNTHNSETLDLRGVELTRGVSFSFTGSNVESLAPGERVVVVRNLEAFEERYGDQINVAGAYTGKLANGGEGLALVDSLGGSAFDFSYKDGWYDITDGDGFSLTVRDTAADPATLAEKSAWQPSALVDGTPGSDDPGPVLGSVIINEILTHTDDSVTGDWIELFNTTAQPVDLSGWYLSDSRGNLRKFRIPDGTIIPGGGYVTFNQFGPGGFGVDSLLENPLGNPGAFGLSELGDALRLTSVDAARIRENIDAVHVIDQNRIIFSTATSAVLGTGTLSFRNGDLVEFNTSTGIATLIFSESVFRDPTGLLPAGENIDAISVLSSGDLVLSTAGTARIGELSFRDGDLVRYNPTTGVATRLISEDLFTGRADINAVHVFENAGQIERYVISTDGPATIDGVLYDDGDLIEIVPGSTSDLAAGLLGDGSVRRFLAESVFVVGSSSSGDPTENIDAVSFTSGGSLAISTSSTAAFVGLGEPFQNGDLVQLTPGQGSDLGSGIIGNNAQLELLFEEDPDAGNTFYGEAAGYREKVDFAGAEREITFGLYIKSDGLTDFVAMISPSKGQANGDPRVGPIVFNEVMYNPSLDDSDGIEFIELLNITDSPVDMSDWAFTAGIGLTFPQGVIVPAGGLALVVPVDEATFRAAYSVPASVPVVGPYTSVLNNGGEKIELSRPGDPEPDGFFPLIEVARLAYDDELPWPTKADGEGFSLQNKQPEQYGNDPINWGTTIPGGTIGDFVVAPRVSEVLVWGSGWSQEMLDRLAADGLGIGGASIPAGSSQLQTVAWSGIDRISIRFSEDVEVQSDHLNVLGVDIAEYDVVGFSYNSSSHTATWSLGQTPRADKLRLVLSGEVKDPSGLPLDGGWTDSVSAFPSGNGAIDTDDAFRFRFDVLTGDAVPGGGVDRRDLIEVIHHLGGSASGAAYDPRLDINADGLIDVLDLRTVLLRNGTDLPAGQPRSSSGRAPAIAADVLFSRLGAGPAPQPAAHPARETSLLGSSENSTSRSRRPIESSVVDSTDQRLARRRAGGSRASAEAVDAVLSVEASELRERITSARRGRRGR